MQCSRQRTAPWLTVSFVIARSTIIKIWNVLYYSIMSLEILPGIYGMHLCECLKVAQVPIQSSWVERERERATLTLKIRIITYVDTQTNKHTQTTVPVVMRTDRATSPFAISVTRLLEVPPGLYSVYIHICMCQRITGGHSRSVCMYVMYVWNL
jgi:hypothetical protein